MTGPSGASGPSGPSGGGLVFTTATAVKSVTGIGSYLATATCPANSVLVGGGTETQGFSGILFDSFPSKPGVAGTFTGQASAGIGDRGSLRVTAICAIGATAQAGTTTFLSGEVRLDEAPSPPPEPEAEPEAEVEEPGL